MKQEQVAPEDIWNLVPNRDVDLDVALHTLHDLSLRDGDLGAEYWESVMRILVAAGAMHAELVRLRNEAKGVR